MKYLYVCEKCGKQFEDYTAASNCEESHLRIDNKYHEYDYEMAKFSVWGEGDKMPRQAVFATPVVHDDRDDEECCGCLFGLYEFKRHLLPEEIQKIVAEHRARKKLENKLREELERERTASNASGSADKNDATE